MNFITSTNRFYLLIFCCLLLLTSSLGLFTIFIWSNEYGDFLQQLIHTFNLLDKASSIEEQYLTQNRFRLLRYTAILSFFMLSGFTLLFYQKRVKVQQWQAAISKEVNHWLTDQYANWKGFPTTERSWFLGFFLGLTILKITLAFLYPIHIDEAFSYVFLVSKGPLVTATFYPGPNNHVAYLLICSLLHQLGFNPEVVMRVPSLAFSILTIPLAYLLLRRHVKFSVALLCLALFSFNEFSLFYATHGRGYAMQLFFMVSSLWAGLQFSQTKNHSSQLIFTLTCILGFYTIPSFLYFFCSLLLAYFLQFRAGSFRVKPLTTLLLIVTGVGILYLPIVLLSGIERIISNTWVQPMTIQAFLAAFPTYIWRMQGNLMGWETAGASLSLLVWCLSFSFIFAPSFIQSHGKSVFSQRLTIFQVKGLGILILSISLFPLLLLPIQRVLPFDRVWYYKSLVEFFVLAIGSSYLLAKIRKKLRRTLLISVALCYISIHLFAPYSYISDKKSIYRQFPILIHNVLNSTAKHIFVNEDVYNVFLRYEGLKQGKTYAIEVENPKGSYDVLILRKGFPFPSTLDSDAYIPFYQDDFVSAWQKR
ncbi:MAG: hypothetical protein ACPGJS_19195 [Flammeovirgaceae bacterium]